MKKKNKKTKAGKKKIVVKAVKSKKAIKKSVPKGRAVKRIKNENVLGSIAKLQAEDLGTKILVQEIQEEPKILLPEVPLAEEAIILEENLINPLEPVDEVAAEQVETQIQEDIQPQYQNNQAGAEEYYKQKEMSPRQKNIIMYVSLTAIMSVLVVFWGLSIKNSMSQGIATSGFGAESQNFLNELQGTFNDFQTGISEVTNQNQSADITDPAFEDIKQQIVTDKVRDDIANQLKEKLENLNTNTNIVNTNITNNN